MSTTKDSHLGSTLTQSQYQQLESVILELNSSIQAAKKQLHGFDDQRVNAAIKSEDYHQLLRELKTSLSALEVTSQKMKEKFPHTNSLQKQNTSTSNTEEALKYDRQMIEEDDADLGKIIKEIGGQEKEEIYLKTAYFEQKLNTAQSRQAAREAYLKELFKEIEESKNQSNPKDQYLEEAFHQLDTVYAQIKSSVNYAQRFQEAMLPKLERLQAVFQDCFVFMKPREIVSGDFYWFQELTPQKYILAALDCTGHGVPGAFMSLLGYDLLNNIVNQQKIWEPAEILRRLHIGVRRALNQNATQNRDGMDAALCLIDKEQKTLTYAGAHNPLLFIQNDQVHFIKADPFAVGGYEKEGKRDFKQYQFEIEGHATFYIYSDGYQDQIGGVHGRRFMASRLRNILHEIHHKPMHKQRKILNKIIEYWMKDKRQMDDMLVVGIRI